MDSDHLRYEKGGLTEEQRSRYKELAEATIFDRIVELEKTQRGLKNLAGFLLLMVVLLAYAVIYYH